MGQFTAPKKVLDLSSTSTPPLIAASYATGNAAPGLPYGQPISQLVMFEVTRAGTLTAVKFRVLGSRTGAAGTWVPLSGYLASDATRALVNEFSVAAGSVATFYDAAVVDVVNRDWPFLDVQAKSVGADAAAGDSAKAWLPAGSY